MINKIKWIGEELLLVSQHWRTVPPKPLKNLSKIDAVQHTSLFYTASYQLCGRAGHQ